MQLRIAPDIQRKHRHSGLVPSNYQSRSNAPGFHRPRLQSESQIFGNHLWASHADAGADELHGELWMSDLPGRPGRLTDVVAPAGSKEVVDCDLT